MKGLERRIERLERRRGARMHVVLVADAGSPWADSEALEAVGLEPDRDDLVVMIKQFSPGNGPRFLLVGEHEGA